MIYMIRSTILLSSVLWMSCNETKPDSDSVPIVTTKTVRVQLIDSLGTITLSVPGRYDTSFSWIHYSDCGKPCDDQKYRFQSKSFPLLKESGFFWDEPKDSIDRFTISHKRYFPFHDGDTTKIFGVYNRIKENLRAEPESPPIVFDTVQKINDRYFSIVAMESSDTIHAKKVFAVTTIKNNEMMFLWELLTTKNDSIEANFINNSLDLIKTIYISQGI